MNKLYKRFLALFAILVMDMGTLLAQATKDDYLNSYLTVESLADNDTVILHIPAELTTEQMSWVAYSTDATNWTTLEVDGTLQRDTIILNQGEKLYFKGLGKQCDTVIDNYWYYICIRGKADHKVYGNIMSLLYGDDFASQTAFPEGSTYAFGYLFHSDKHLVSIENLMLPATTLAYGCYYGMFVWCSSIASPTPELPATELEESCYMYMYYNCEALPEAPELPATTLAPKCYYRMFNECFALTTAPELPATTLADKCYAGMFTGCTSLTTVHALPATTLAEKCYHSMFIECSSLTTAPELPATTLAEQCYQSMFRGCSSLTTAPELPATNLAPSCYTEMFYGCELLTSAPELPASTLAYSCYSGMFLYCSSLTQAPVMQASVLAPYCCYYMFGYCASLTEVPALQATTLADQCYICMFIQCTSLTKAPALPATSLATECYAFMFFDCTSLTEPPVLPATTMADGCYKAMFDGCASLTKGPDLPAPVLVFECYAGLFERCPLLEEVVCLATDISSQECTLDWMNGVASTGVLFKAPEMNDWPINSNSGIPEGWTVANYDGVEEQQTQVDVYPNPVVDQLHITGTDIQSVKVHDIQGRLIHAEECDHANQVDVDFQGFAKGVYSVSIKSKGGENTKTIVR